MKPEEIIDEIPEDVRKALADVMSVYGEADGEQCRGTLHDLYAAIRKRPATVVIPRAEIPAPLTEVPESGVVWVPYMAPRTCVLQWAGKLAQEAMDNGLAYATKEDAQRALDAMMAREPVEAETETDPFDIIPWAYLDPRWKWAAMDEDGVWYAYECIPALGSDRVDSETVNCWDSETGGWQDLVIRGAPVHWTETKVRRPEGV
jgi:hypothetical protein